MKKVSLIILFVFFFLTESLQAVVKNWVSGTTWTTAVWSPAGAPASGDDVFISATNFTFNTPVTCASLNFNGNANTTIGITSALTVTGIMDINVGDRNRTFNVDFNNTTVSIGTIVYPTRGLSNVIVDANGILTVTSQLNLSNRDRITLNGNAILNANGGIVDGAGSFVFSSTCRVNVRTLYQLSNANLTWTSGSTINFDANTVVTVGAALTLTFSNVILSAGTITINNPISVSGNWTNNGGTLSAGANTITLSGTASSIGGTTSTTFGPLALNSGTNYTMNNSNSASSFSFVAGNTATSFTQANSTVFTISGAVTLNQPTKNGVAYNWNINNATATVSGLITFAGITNSATRIARITIVDGILNANGGLTFVTSNAASKQIVMSGGTTGIINLKGALTIPAASSTLTAGTSSTFNYCDASAAQTINYFSAGAYNNLTCNNTSAGGATLSAPITAANVTGNLSVQSGTLNNGAFAIVGNAAKAFSVSDGATFRLTGTSIMPTGFGSVNLGVNSTCNFAGTGAQLIAAHNYGNLTSSSTGARTLVAIGTVGVANVFTPGTNIFTITGSTIDFNGTASQTIPLFTYNNLVASTGGTKTLGGAIVVNNDLTISSPAILDVSSSNFTITVRRNWVNNSSFVYRVGTVSFAGSTAQSISGSSTNDFYNISLLPTVSAINVSANSAVNVINDLTFDASPGSLTFTTNGNVTLKSVAGQTARVAAITNPAGLTISGNLNIERFAPGGTTGWTLVGNPGVSGLTFASWDDDTYITCAACPDGYILGGTPFASIQMYSETAGGLIDDAVRYSEIASPSDPITLGKGYWMYMGDGEFTTNDILYDVSGPINKGNFSIPITVTGGASLDHGWNLIANPYPSPISWDLVRNGNANVDAEILVYNPDVGAYASYAGGVGTNGLSNTGAIPMGQGFYVHASVATTLNFTESVKSNTQSPLLRLNGNNTITNASIAQTVLRLNVSGSSGQDETVIHYNSNATSNWDSDWDAHKLAGYDYYAPSISTLTNGIDYSINALPSLNGSSSVPLLVKTGTPATYTISVGAMNNFPQGACMQLTDLLLNTTHDLSTGGYVCYLSDTATVPRFLLNVTLNNNLTISTSTIQNTCSGNGLITAIGNNAGPWNYYWKDVEGNVIKTSLNKSVADSLSQLSEGVYSVEVSTVGGCNSAVENFTINAPIAPLADFSSSAAETITLVNGVATVDFTNNSVNADTYAWDFGDGNVSNQISPQHNYTMEGNYEVSLSASNLGCGVQNVMVKNISVVSESFQIVSNITNLACANISDGKIIAQGTNNGPWDYVWLDGANTIVRAMYAKAGPDTLSNLAAGVYTLRMRTQGASTDIVEVLQINAPVAPISSFSVNMDTVDLNLGTGMVTFTNTSGNASSYFWNFGDVSYSQAMNPTHVYSVGGSYVVSLIAYNASCGDYVTSYHVIEVIDAFVGLKNEEVVSGVLVGQNSSNEVFIKFMYENETPVIVSVYNTLGAKIMQDVSLNASNEVVNLNIPEMAEQLLLIEIKAENRNTVVEKVIRKKL